MAFLGLKDAAASPSFITQYGPLIAALITLLGVMATLTVNGRRERKRYQSQREDEYRLAQRNAIAAIAVAGLNFRRECAALIDPSSRSVHRASAEDATAILLNELTLARLLIQDSSLQALLDDVAKAYRAVGVAVDQIGSSFMTRISSAPGAGESLESKLHDFDVTTRALYTQALNGLKPTIADAKPRRRGVARLLQ